MLLKRWLLDNVLSRWVKKNIIDNISKSIKEAKGYYLGLDKKSKIKNTMIGSLFFALLFGLLYSSGYFVNMVLFTEIKIVVLAISKTVLMVLGQIAGWLTHSWITPILEVFAFSWLFRWLEKRFGPRHPINIAINKTAELFSKIFFRAGAVMRKYIDPLLNDTISRKSREIGEKLSIYIKEKKIAREYEKFDLLERAIMNGHIDAYHRFDGMEKIRDKQKLYSMINKNTSDGIDIVAFVSRNSRGDLLPSDFDDSFYDDVFLLEGTASSNRRGVGEELLRDPDKSDFWILNTSLYPLTLKSHTGSIEPIHIQPQSLRLIKSKTFCGYDTGELYASYKGRTESFVPVATR